MTMAKGALHDLWPPTHRDATERLARRLPSAASGCPAMPGEPDDRCRAPWRPGRDLVADEVPAPARRRGRVSGRGRYIDRGTQPPSVHAGPTWLAPTGHTPRAEFREPRGVTLDGALNKLSRARYDQQLNALQRGGCCGLIGPSDSRDQARDEPTTLWHAVTFGGDDPTLDADRKFRPCVRPSRSVAAVWRPDAERLRRRLGPGRLRIGMLP